MVTFNGKTYDKELLECRYRLARMASPFDQLIHIDMLFACRRLWKAYLPLTLALKNQEAGWGLLFQSRESNK